MSVEEVTRAYIEQNRQAAENLMIFLQSRRLLRDRYQEDFEECRKSAHTLRRVLENVMLTVKGRGMLLEALTDMQRACTAFVSAAGRKSENFKQDGELFTAAHRSMRLVFAHRVRLIVDVFELSANREIQAIMEAERG
jgi:galactokinase